MILQKIERALHQIPETALEEFKTKEYLKNYLISIGLEPQEDCCNLWIILFTLRKG